MWSNNDDLLIGKWKNSLITVNEKMKYVEDMICNKQIISATIFLGYRYECDDNRFVSVIINWLF